MKWINLAVLFGILCAGSSAEAEADSAESERPGNRPNVLFIAVDDLRCDLGAYGVAHAITPRLDEFSATARVFTQHYVQVPTCGASRAVLLSGRYPSEPAHVGNGAIAKTHARWGDANLPKWFRQHGYRTLALGKVTHHPGGRTGHLWAEGPEELPDSWDRCWIPETLWGEPERMMHGYANGQPRTRGESPPIESFNGPDHSYPDAHIADEAVATLSELATSDQPWFFAVGFFKPHLPFAAPKSWFDKHDPSKLPPLPLDVAAKPSWPSGWHGSGEFRGNYAHSGRDPKDDAEYAGDLRQAYAACTSYVDWQIGKVLDTASDLKLTENTIVVVWSDHGFLLGEHAIWGKHCLYEEALRSPLLIRVPELKDPGAASETIVETVDLFPTLTDLCGLPVPADIDGQSLKSLVIDANASAKSASQDDTALSFWTGDRKTIRTERWRLILHPRQNGEKPAIELFDYDTDPRETRNHAEKHPEVVRELTAKLGSVGETRPQP